MSPLPQQQREGWGMGMVAVSPQQLLSATPFSLHFFPAKALAVRGSQFLQETPRSPGLTSSRGCSVDICSPRAAGKYQPHHGLSNSCCGTSAPVFGAPLPTPSLTLVPAGLFFTLFFLTPYHICDMFCLFLTMLSQRCLTHG